MTHMKTRICAFELMLLIYIFTKCTNKHRKQNLGPSPSCRFFMYSTPVIYYIILFRYYYYYSLQLLFFNQTQCKSFEK